MMTVHKHGRDWKVIMGAPESRPPEPPKTLEKWIAEVEAEYLASPSLRLDPFSISCSGRAIGNVMHDAVRILAERGNISCCDAKLLLAWVSHSEILSALRDASVWELRDRVLKQINTYTSKAS